MTARKCFIVAAGLMTASAAHADDTPSNAELFRMLKAQQQTISELRAELKASKRERSAATPREVREAATAARPAGRDAAKETVVAAPPAQAYAMYTKGSAVLPTPGHGAYVGVFGGGGSRNSSSVSQFGTAFFPEAVGGPLAIDAMGRTGSGGVGFGGAHLGYEWSHGAYLRPALEIEGFYLAGNQQRATLLNPTARLVEQAFDNTFPTRTTVLLANMVVGFRTPYQGITPYIGGGIGAANVSITGATSTQTDPPEAGINHFNARPELLSLDLCGTGKGRCAPRPRRQRRLPVWRVPLFVCRRRQSGFWLHHVSHSCCDQPVDDQLRRDVPPSGSRRRRLQLLAEFERSLILAIT